MSMPECVVAFVVPGILASVGILLIMLRCWMWLRAARRQLCPGPCLRWRQRLMPVWMVFKPRCGYDLSGHRFEPGRPIICPECGRGIQRTRQMLRSPRAWRPAHLGSIFIIAGLLIYRYPPMSAMTLVRCTPTDLLLRGEGLLGIGTPLEVRDEIRRRAMDHQLTDPQISLFVQLLVNDLKDGGSSGVSERAMQSLAFFAVFDEQPLLDALHSDDWQQRWLAARVLRSMPSRPAPSDELLSVTIEQLRSRARYEAREAMWYLQQYLDPATPLLVKVMHSEDFQQRRYVVDLLRSAGLDGELLKELLEVEDGLIQISMDHLRDDHVTGNAREAEDFLFRRVDRAAPLLVSALQSGDRQQRSRVAHLLWSAEIGGDALDQLLTIAVDDLASDDQNGNAERAEDFLRSRVDQARPMLLNAMHSADQQQRRAVLNLLRQTETTGDVFQALLQLSVEELRSTTPGSKRTAFNYLSRHAAAADPLLRDAMQGDDAMQRLLCAAAAGCGGHQPLIDVATPILISHLADNSIRDDAIIAARALWGFGRNVLPLLEPVRSSTDEQQRQSVEYIVQRMTTDKSLVRLERELPLSRLTGASFDALTVDPQRLKIPWFSNERLAGAGAAPSG